MIDLPPFMDLPPGYIRDGSGLIKKMVLPGISFPAIMIGSAKQVSPTTKTILLTSGSSFTVPSDWNSNQPGSGGFANKIECIASGATGNQGSYFTNAGDGGKGGAYAAIQDYTASPGASVSYQIGNAAGSTSQRHTFFGASTYASSPVAAESGYGGGRASQSIGTTKYSGGAGGPDDTGSGSGGGGGSAARPTANGTAGSSPSGAAQSAVLWTDNSGGANNGLQARSGGGGSGGSLNSNGSVGGSYGGGGGGGGGSGDVQAGAPGGTGGPGLIAITYYPLI